MIPNPIHKVLSTLSTNQVQYLLMGGQACVFYGGAEFSRDCDIAVLCDAGNLANLQSAIDELQAERIAVPPFDVDYLKRGHAVHFRCQAAGVEGMRLDVMSKMRGVDDFKLLWQRRTTITDESGTEINLMALPDLVAAKTTQRDKDWPMIRRLIEAHFAQNRQNATEAQVKFWLSSSRTPEHLIDLANENSELAESLLDSRPLLKDAQRGDAEAVSLALEQERLIQCTADQLYWQPLKKELEMLPQRHRN